MDHEAWLKDGMAGADEPAKKAYQFFMRPEPKEDLGEVQEEHDALTGRVMKFREGRIGMVRNAKSEDKRGVRIYLDPLPHIRIDDAKPLQGWYKDSDRAAPEQRDRPRPCFTDAMLTEPYGGYCTVGCAFSVLPGEPVDGPSGPRAIERIAVGDYVWGRTNRGIEPALVLGTTRHWKPEGYVALVLSNGVKLRITGDHPVYSASRCAWVPAEELQTGEQLEALPRLLRSRFEDKNCLLPLSSRDPSPERTKNAGASFRTEGTAQEQGSSDCNEQGSSTQSTQYEPAGSRSENGRVASRTSRGRADRHQRLSAVEAGSLHVSEGANVPHEIGVGAIDGSVARCARNGVGLRTLGAEAAQRSSLPAGLPFVGRSLHRGERLRHGSGSREDRASTSGGASCAVLDGQEAPSAGDSLRVVSLSRVSGGLWVHDIQTTSHNFFLRGTLTHNCYVNSGFRGYRGSGLISVPINYGAQVAKQLSKLKTSAAGYFSSFTDPFLPLEDFYHNTQRGAEAFVANGLPIFFLSRLQYPDWAINLLRKNKYSYAQKSINTPDPETWRKLSPGALGLEEHLEDIRKLRAAGIYVSIQCNPVVPGVVTHDDVERLFERLAEAGANHVIVKFVEAGFSWAPAMVERILKRFGEERGGAFRDLFTDNIGGQRTIVEDYRMEGHRRYSRKAAAVGLTYATCYEYAYERDPTGEILSKRGYSIGKQFLTGDQCHGHRVPMFSRTDLALPFMEVEECPPTGCLSCADDNNGQPRCGSALFGSAKALRLPDFKQPVKP